MSNILQVTDPSTYIDNRNVHTGQEQQSALNSSQIQNPSDPSRVVRADGQKSGTAGDQENESGFSVRNYNGNYTDFLQKLGQENEIKDSLGRILFRDGAFIAKGDEGLGKMVQQLLDSASFEDSGQLLDFLKMQGQTKFSGTFFENLRTLLQQEGNRGLQETALKFLQVFNNYSSGEHLLEQMQELTDEIKGMLYTSARQEYASILDQLDWKAENGETKENSQVLFQKLVPFLSRYISRTHDYGNVRSSVIQLILYGARYENGSSALLRSLFEQMAANRDFKRFFETEPEELYAVLTGSKGKKGNIYGDIFGSLVERGAKGEAGLEHVQDFYQLMRGMLVNESVYMSVNHFVLPFQYQGKEAVSEFWIDPDAEKKEEEKDGGRKIRLLVDFEIRGLGDFQLLADLQDHKISMELGVPKNLSAGAGEIQAKLQEICTRNGMRVKMMQVQERKAHYHLLDVFPKIRKKENRIFHGIWNQNRYMAEKITEAARKSGVPVYEDDSLATLLSRLQLGAAVPEELYQAIIEIYIYFLGYVLSPEEKENEEKVENT